MSPTLGEIFVHPPSTPDKDEPRWGGGRDSLAFPRGTCYLRPVCLGFAVGAESVKRALKIMNILRGVALSVMLRAIYSPTDFDIVALSVILRAICSPTDFDVVGSRLSQTGDV